MGTPTPPENQWTYYDESEDPNDGAPENLGARIRRVIAFEISGSDGLSWPAHQFRAVASFMRGVLSWFNTHVGIAVGSSFDGAHTIGDLAVKSNHINNGAVVLRCMAANSVSLDNLLFIMGIVYGGGPHGSEVVNWAFPSGLGVASLTYDNTQKEYELVWDAAMTAAMDSAPFLLVSAYGRGPGTMSTPVNAHAYTNSPTNKTSFKVVLSDMDGNKISGNFIVFVLAVRSGGFQFV